MKQQRKKSFDGNHSKQSEMSNIVCAVIFLFLRSLARSLSIFLISFQTLIRCAKSFKTSYMQYSLILYRSFSDTNNKLYGIYVDI